MSIEWRQRRIAHNEASFRDINEQLERGLRQVPDAPELLEFICECGDRECEQWRGIAVHESTPQLCFRRSLY